ncbi:hypothetical protein TNCV_3515851 [Trichonephila clavipes]|nr:hypothetical protein TNCV_3515851 [Trichonephila clavipes]
MDVSAFSRIALHARFSIKLLFIPLISLLKKPASDPKNVVIHSSENQLAAFKNFVVIHSHHQRIARTRRRVRVFVEAGLIKPKLKDLIVKSPDFVEEDVKVVFDSIVKDRIRTEEKEKKL